jgi:predicted TPR repeat methyltransferase
MLPIAISNTPNIFPWTIQKYYKKSFELIQQEKWQEAACFLNYLAYLYPHLTAIKFKLACCQMELGCWESAEYHLSTILDNTNPDPDILCNLAIVYWQTKQYKSALKFFNYTLKYFPEHQKSRQNLASFFLQFNRLNQAIFHYQIILNQSPDNVEVRFNLAACLQKQGIYDEAIVLYKNILQKYRQHYDSLYNLGTIYFSLHDFKAAKFYWNDCLKIKPSQASLLFMMEHIENKEISLQHHQSYVKELFDDYAHFYETHMHNNLNYKLPSFLKDYLKKHYTKKELNLVLEIGCGTGLCAEAIFPYAKKLDGIDVSEKMIEKAKLKGLYDELSIEDCLVFLNKTTTNYNLMLAMDVTPYLADFESVLKAAYHRLSIQGELIFTIECADTDNRKLQANGRFCYLPNFVEEICQNLKLKLLSATDFIARNEHEIPVIEKIYHWKKI